MCVVIVEKRIVDLSDCYLLMERSIGRQGRKDQPN